MKLILPFWVPSQCQHLYALSVKYVIREEWIFLSCASDLRVTFCGYGSTSWKSCVLETKKNELIKTLTSSETKFFLKHIESQPFAPECFIDHSVKQRDCIALGNVNKVINVCGWHFIPLFIPFLLKATVLQDGFVCVCDKLRRGQWTIATNVYSLLRLSAPT